MRFTSFVVIAAFVAPILAGPVALKTVETAKERVEGRYIVTLKPTVKQSTHIDRLQSKFRGNAMIVHAQWDPKFLNGFAAKLSTEALNDLRAHPDVASISEDGIAHAFATGIQTDAPWGLRRISNRDSMWPSTDTNALAYTYDYNADGSGVDVYVLDTGIYTDHTTFGGRARWGATFGGYANADGNGHGTHCAGIVGGSQYGVAKNVNLIAVKVLGNSGSGANSDVISGLDWVASQARLTGRPSIATLSLGSPAYTALDSAVSSLVSSGVHVTVAAGNEYTDAANTSPARVTVAITVGASTITDARADYSNYGSVVDVFAPGTGIISSWIGSPTASKSDTGTSMATPHVAGIIAYLLSNNPYQTPADIQNQLKRIANKDILSGIPSGTPNNLVFNIF